jgi:hypothetical protein
LVLRGHQLLVRPRYQLEWIGKRKRQPKKLADAALRPQGSFLHFEAGGIAKKKHIGEYPDCILS